MNSLNSRRAALALLLKVIDQRIMINSFSKSVIKEFSKWAPFMDGFLIGGASQSPKKFIDIIKNYYK